MADSAVSVLDSAGTARSVDAQLPSGGDYQQTVTVGDGVNAGRVAGVDSTGNLKTRGIPVGSTTGTMSSLAGSVSSVTLLAANAARVSFAIFNDSASILYVAMSSVASTTSYTFQLNPGAYYEPPAGFLYTGVIAGIWVTATGSARITEFT
jgi:hypothetical protein